MKTATTEAIHPSEMVIRTLYGITSEYQQGFDEQVKRILELGCRRFDLDIGILSQVIDDRYEVRQFVAPEGMPLQVGQCFDLPATYCCVTLEAGGPVGFEHCARSEMARHPAYKAFQLEAYIGVPVVVDGDVYGTLNFSSPAARSRAFDDVDVDALQLMATWIGGEIQRRRTEDALRRATEELQRLTWTDPLTELLNRRGLEAKLSRIASRVAEGGAVCTAMLVDLDDFKGINDRHGHDSGDCVIAHAARSIGRTVRPTDIVGRVGGDEFLVLLPDTTVDQARPISERVRSALASDMVCLEEGDVTFTATLGIAPVTGQAPTITEILAGVSKVLASGKRAGKNRIVTA